MKLWKEFNQKPSKTALKVFLQGCVVAGVGPVGIGGTGGGTGCGGGGVVGLVLINEEVVLVILLDETPVGIVLKIEVVIVNFVVKVELLVVVTGILSPLFKHGGHWLLTLALIMFLSNVYNLKYFIFKIT